MLNLTFQVFTKLTYFQSNLLKLNTSHRKQSTKFKDVRCCPLISYVLMGIAQRQYKIDYQTLVLFSFSRETLDNSGPCNVLVQSKKNTGISISFYSVASYLIDYVSLIMQKSKPISCLPKNKTKN